MGIDFHPHRIELQFVADNVHAVLHELAHRPSLEAVRNALLTLMGAFVAVQRAGRTLDQERLQ